MFARFMIVILPFLAISDVALARDDALFLPLQDALNTPEAKEQLNQGVKFYFGDKAPGYINAKGSFVANRKTNAFNKSDEEACKWVFLSALVALRDRALAEGGNAVVNIHSFYKQNKYMSDSDYECHAGAIMAGVALKGTVVTLK